MNSAPRTQTVYTVGHSTRSIGELAGLLTEAAIELLVDVRSLPRSRRHPQFNIEVLPGSLAPFGIDYKHLAALGGLRDRPREAPPSANTFWRNESFRNYADYAMTGEFAAGMERLRGLANINCCAIMCSEAVWWRCHRRIISDYLLTEGFEVRHIMGEREVKSAVLTPGAEKLPGGALVYPG
ncbi:MAG TPA: DUF488 domain-containing protein [Burkholderiales bacterium]|nr:DUF488 domain-containing protein [Burkholderiales bacterium]